MTLSQRQDVKEIIGLETLSEESMTIPDMSLSVKQILERYRRGTIDLVDLHREGYYDESADIDSETFGEVDDLVDLMEQREELNGKIFEMVRSMRNTARDTPQNPPAGEPGPEDTAVE